MGYIGSRLNQPLQSVLIKNPLYHEIKMSWNSTGFYCIPKPPNSESNPKREQHWHKHFDNKSNLIAR